MCTVSWVHEADGYQLFCNRDEKLTRAEGLPPRVFVRGGLRFLAPVDGDFGGAWIGVNEFGVAACLVNGVFGEPGRAGRGPAPRSRGLVIPDLLGVRSRDEMLGRIACADFTPYASFTLTLLEPRRPASLVLWDGTQKTLAPCGDAYMPLVSSSFDPIGVRARRLAEFERTVDTCGGIDAELLAAFHCSHGLEKNAYSACMHRADAKTVSFSRIRVGAAGIDFSYTPGSPCGGAPTERYTLAPKGDLWNCCSLL